MKFAERIFERATIKGVADYLLYGMVPDKDDRSYETRLEDADLIYEKVAKQYGEDGASVLLSAASELVNENASVWNWDCRQEFCYSPICSKTSAGKGIKL